MWRGVLNWAKYGAGVAQPTAHWTEEERLRVCQQLQGVINHVRLLLIGNGSGYGRHVLLWLYCKVLL